MLNQTQRKYVTERLTQLANRHNQHITDEIQARKVAPLTDEEKCDAIRKNTAKLVLDRVRVAPSRYGQSVPLVTECFDFPGEKKAQADSEKLDKEREKRLADVRLAAAHLKDTAILGTEDESKLLSFLQAFENKTF